VSVATPEPLERTLAAALAAAQETAPGEYAVVPLAEHEFNREVVRLARAEFGAFARKDLAEKSVNGTLERQAAYWAAKREWAEAYRALHVAVDARPEGEEPRGG